MFNDFEEPAGAFPYKKPSVALISRYSYMYELDVAPKIRKIKRLFDVVFAAIALLILCIPFCILFLAYLIEYIFVPTNRGPFLYYYYSVSRGRHFKKWKIRQFRWDLVDPEKANSRDWRAFAVEWDESARTYVGTLAKQFYLDEIPQFWSVLIGNMSIVGPRPLAIHHYERDLSQGNITRKLLVGGLLGFGHVRKGTEEFGDPTFEFEYADIYVRRNSLALISLDLWIIWRGLLLITKGGGH